GLTLHIRFRIPQYGLSETAMHFFAAAESCASGSRGRAQVTLRKGWGRKNGKQHPTRHECGALELVKHVLNLPSNPL
ncbi:MAG: hypothetical protein ACPGGB_11125, partial [Flavobacteriales bacterium]